MKMLGNTILTDANAYARSKEPWLLDEYREASGETTDGKKFGWRLFHYISGGGMRTFGRTVQQEEKDARQTRFLVFAGVLGVVWAAMLVLT